VAQNEFYSRRVHWNHHKALKEDHAQKQRAEPAKMNSFQSWIIISRWRGNLPKEGLDAAQRRPHPPLQTQADFKSFFSQYPASLPPTLKATTKTWTRRVDHGDDDGRDHGGEPAVSEALLEPIADVPETFIQGFPGPVVTLLERLLR